jgi:hypothetical protein
VRKEKATDTKVVPYSVVRSPTPTTSADNANGADKGDAPERVIDGNNSGEDEVSLPWFVVPRWRL